MFKLHQEVFQAPYTLLRKMRKLTCPKSVTDIKKGNQRMLCSLFDVFQTLIPFTNKRERCLRLIVNSCLKLIAFIVYFYFLKTCKSVQKWQSTYVKYALKHFLPSLPSCITDRREVKLRECNTWYRKMRYLPTRSSNQPK